MTQSRLGAISLIVPDYDEGIAFFSALGWRVSADIDQGRKRWVTVTDGALQIVIARADGPAQTAAIGQQWAGRVGLFLHTDDFDAMSAAIIAAGGRMAEAPRDEPYGRVAVWEDPWGNRWDLIQPA